MKPCELFRNWDEYKDRFKEHLVESTDDNLMFSAYTNDEIYGNPLLSQEKTDTSYSIDS